MPEVRHFTKNGVEYYQLYIACPVCLKEGRPTTPEYWKHTKDDGDMYIGDNGYYYCLDCGYSAPIIEWGYVCCDCKKAGHEKSVYLDDLKHLGEALSISGMVTGLAGLEWLNRVTASLLKQCK